MISPLVSVLMPAFNAEAYIGEAIKSVIDQGYRNWELVIVNDGSSDGTGVTARQFGDERVRVIDLPVNTGLAAVRNRSVAEARGDLIAFLDADDRMSANRLQIQVRQFLADPKLGLCGGQIAFFKSGESATRESSLPLSCDDIQAAMLFFDPIATSTVMARRSLLQSFPFRDAFPPLEDYDVWQRMTQTCDVLNLPEVVAEYRIHHSQSSITINHRNEQKLKDIRTERLRYIYPGCTQHDADMHHLICELTAYWSQYDSIRPACDYAVQLCRVAQKTSSRSTTALRRLVRDKLLALTYYAQPHAASSQRLTLSKTLLKAPLRIGWYQCCKDLMSYRLFSRAVHSTSTNLQQQRRSG